MMIKKDFKLTFFKHALLKAPCNNISRRNFRPKNKK